MGTTGRTSSAAEFAERQQEQQLAKRAEQLGVTIGPNTPAKDVALLACRFMDAAENGNAPAALLAAHNGDPLASGLDPMIARQVCRAEAAHYAAMALDNAKRGL